MQPTKYKNLNFGLTVGRPIHKPLFMQNIQPKYFIYIPDGRSREELHRQQRMLQ